MSVNKVILVGNLGKDPELRYTPNGTAVANFPIATSENFKDSQGNKQERTEWHNIVVWRQLAEICGKYLHKGKQVYIEGKLQTRKWQDKNGVDRYTTEIVADSMQMLGSSDQASTGQQQSAPQQQQQQGQAYSQPQQQAQGIPPQNMQQPHPPQTQGAPQNWNQNNQFDSDIPF